MTGNINVYKNLSRQAFKAVPSPGFRLSNGIASWRVRNMPLPYTGPPSYDTVVRGFSSDVDPQAYFARNCGRQQEAKDRGETFMISVAQIRQITMSRSRI